MKKRLLCLALALLLVLPMILASCGDEMTPEEIANANFQEANKALTLSLWIPTDAVIDEKFSTRMTAVENAINDYLRSNNYSTELEIVAINVNEYAQKLSARFDKIKEFEKTEGKASLVANKYVNHAVLNKETGIYEMAYPDVLNTQLDIFFVGGYENLLTYVNGGDAYCLDGFFTEGKEYNGLFKKIRSIFMDATKIDGKYYAIPNNYLFADNGQYILINKEMFDANSDVEWNENADLYSLKEYIEKIGALNLENVIPYVGTSDNIPGVIYLDKENFIASSISNAYYDNNAGTYVYEPELLNTLDEYKSYMKFYKSLKEQAYVADELAEGKTAAVQLVTGNALGLKDIKDDYYVIEAMPPYVEADSMFSSMFSISTHSADYERSMQILYLLQDNEDLRTLLQYGVNDVDYELVGFGENKVLVSRDSGYKMNILYTGNCYRTYPDNGLPMSYWDSIKELNYKVAIHPYMSLLANISSGNISSEEATQLEECLSAAGTLNAEIKAKLEKMTLKEYEDLPAASRTLKEVKALLDESTNNYNLAKEAFDAATTDDEKNAASADMEKYDAEMKKYQEEVDYWTVLKDFNTKLNDRSRSNLLDAYEELYN